MTRVAADYLHDVRLLATGPASPCGGVEEHEQEGH